mgnify:CR=1 FL=1
MKLLEVHILQTVAPRDVVKVGQHLLLGGPRAIM